MSFWSDWLLISGGANPNYGSTATTDPNEISAFKTLTTAVTRHATSIDKLSSAKRIKDERKHPCKACCYRREH